MNMNNENAGRGIRLPVALVFALATGSLAASQTPDALFETALASFNLERYEEAAKRFYDFMAAAPNDPRNDEAQYFVGRAFMHRRFFNKAIEEFEYLVEDFPESDFARLGLFYTAGCFIDTREPAKAAAAYERLIAFDVTPYYGEEDAMRRMLYENHRAAVFWLAKYHLERQEHERAVTAYRRLPNPIEAFRNIVEVYYGLGQFDRIRELIDGLQQEHRHHGFKLLIEFYSRMKAINQLRDAFAMLLSEQAPDNYTDDLVLTTAEGFHTVGMDHWEWAMRRIMEHYPRLERRANYRLCEHNQNNHAFLEEMELFVIRFQGGRDVNTVLRWKGILQERHAEADAARQDYRRMTDSGLGHWFVAESHHGPHSREKDIEKALEEYEHMRRAFYSEEWAALAQWRSAELLIGDKQIDRAVDALRQVVSRFGALVVENKWHGDIDRHHSFHISKREYGPDAQLLIGDALRENGRPEDAIMEYRALINRWPKSEQAAWAAYRTALCYEDLDDPDTAIRVIQSVLRRYPETRAAGDAHTRLESRYKIADIQISDGVDFFDSPTEIEHDYMERPELMRRDQ